MPDKKEKPKPASTSILQRLFGPMSESTAKDWPALEQSFAGRQVEMPNETAKMSRLGAMGPLSKLIYPDAYAVTGPMGSIMMNRELIERDKQNLDDVLAHELAHVGQGGKGFIRKYYEPQKVEDEAVNREAMRNARKEDIVLRGGTPDPTIAERSKKQIPYSSKKQDPAKSFFQKYFGREELQPPQQITGVRG